MKNILPFAIGLLGISIMILVHELGHYIAARMFHIDVETISFGFGPPLLRWGRNKRYQLCVLPFGGYCKLKGEDDLKRALAKKDRHVENAEEGSLYAASPWKRLFLYLFGPLFNFVFSIICFFILLVLPVLSPWSQPRVVLASDYPLLFPSANTSPAESGLHTGDLIEKVDGVAVSSFGELQKLLIQRKDSAFVKVTVHGSDHEISPRNGVFGLAEFINPLVASVNESSPEALAGLKKGDRILSINDNDVTNMFDILELRKTGAAQITMKVSREETVREIKYQPAYEGNVLQIQFALEVEGKMATPRGFGEASVEALKKAASVFSSGIKSIFDILRGKDRLKTTVVGTFAASTSIGEMTAAGFQDSFSKGMRVILYLLGAVSTSLAIANLLPIPSLDGGLILLSFVELIKGRNASPKVYIICQVLGFAVVLLIVLLLQFAS